MKIHLKFFDLIDSLLICLSATDEAVSLYEVFGKIMASYNVKLFTEAFLTKLKSCNSFTLLKSMVLPFITWLDHSILREMVTASKCLKAMQMLKEFEALIDYNQPITSYPIPAPSQLIIPLCDSDYTLVATHCNCNLEEEKLRKVIDVKNFLINMWEVTEHAIQLIAIHKVHRILYWMIPQHVVKIVESKPLYELWQSEIVMISVFPKNIFVEDDGSITPACNIFSFLNVEVTMLYCSCLFNYKVYLFVI